jgi:hypothetical protein
VHLKRIRFLNPTANREHKCRHVVSGQLGQNPFDAEYIQDSVANPWMKIMSAISLNNNFESREILDENKTKYV